MGVAVFLVPAALVQLGGAFERLPEFLDRVRAWSANLRPEALSDGVGALINAVEAPFQPGRAAGPGRDRRRVAGASATSRQR